jgi:rubredoxin
LIAERTVMEFKKWECQVCGFIYDEAEGMPEEDIAPGTRWEDIPEDWTCPDCGAPKSDFEMMEID